MTSARTKNLLWFGVAGVVLLGALFFSAVQLTHAQPSSVNVQASATATTTVTYMTPGTATTTYQIDSQLFSAGKVPNMLSIDSGSLTIQMTASSSVGTLSSLAWQFQCSNNNIDWAGESSTGTVSGSTSSESTSTVTHYWAPGTTATTTKYIANIPICFAYHERIQFYIPGNPATTASSSAFYIEVGLKKNPSTP